MIKSFSRKITTIVMSLIIALMLPISSDAAVSISQKSVVGDLYSSNAYNYYTSFFKNVGWSFVIPGLTTKMCPQGMCKAGNYILISAYDAFGNDDSCIYILDSNGNYKKTVWLKGNKTHVGGITFDGTYVYTANSSEYTVSMIKLSRLTGASNGSSIYADMTIPVRNTSGGTYKASYCYYDRTRSVLWVGHFKSSGPSYAFGYQINGTRTSPTIKYVMKVPAKTQGMFFYGNYVVYSTSEGRNNDSKIYFCKYYTYATKNGVPYYQYESSSRTITAPATSQNIFIDGINLYILFENAADCYYKGYKKTDKAYLGPSVRPVDRVCVYRLS